MKYSECHFPFAYEFVNSNEAMVIKHNETFRKFANCVLYIIVKILHDSKIKIYDTLYFDKETETDNFHEF